MKTILTLTVNGDPHILYLDTRRTLLDILRHELHLPGAHRGCDAGDCGACTVLVNGLPMTSCLLLVADYDGAEILTVEGLLTDGAAMHPIQKALVEKGGIQCGYCTPGIVMNALALLEDNPHPTEPEIRAWLSGNLCRCTGYVKIVEAVKEVS
ncbi:MAG: (2Fe-2S)-binding protein [Anaerolineales bacterium]